MDSVFIIKIISALLYPLGLALVFAILSLLMHLKRQLIGSRIVASIAVMVLLVSSNPMIARQLVSGLEHQYPQLQIESIRHHDAIIVLGGGLRLPTSPAKYVQLGNGSDRYWYAAQLFHAARAKKIMLSGGNLYSHSGLFGEAYYASQLLQRWGVPKEAIEVESTSRTTAENFKNISELATSGSIKSALLVTSAIHMPRAYALFSRLPMTITPASADVIVRHQQTPFIFKILPSASALNLSTIALHEYYGIVFEWLKSWYERFNTQMIYMP